MSQELVEFSFRDVIEAMIRRENIHSGIWSLQLTFGLKAATFAEETTNEHSPGVMVPILGIAIARTDKDGPLSVDAAKVNPKKTRAAKAK